MSVLTTLMNQAATLWAVDGRDANGQPTYAAPAAVMCRWEESTQEILLPNGDRRQSTAVAYVSSDMMPGDRLVLGTSIETDPFVAEALEVLTFKRIEAALITTTSCRKVTLG